MGLVGCKRQEIIDVDDDATDEEIDEIAKDWLFSSVEWSWKKVENKSDV